MISFEHALPLIIFLVVSFLAFYFVETIILLILNHTIRRYWKFVVDRLLRTIVRHRFLMRTLSFGSVAVIIFLLVRYTALADILISGGGVLRLLVLILLFSILIIYLIGSRSLTKVVIERRIHLYVFCVLSLFAFTGIMLTAGKGYDAYGEAINKAFVKPIITNIEQQYEQRVEDLLLDIFSQKIKEGKCEDYDYTRKAGEGLTHFVLIKEMPELAEAGQEADSEKGNLSGKQCVHTTKFLLTPDGKWYEVLEQTPE